MSRTVKVKALPRPTGLLFQVATLETFGCSLLFYETLAFGAAEFTGSSTSCRYLKLDRMHDMANQDKPLGMKSVAEPAYKYTEGTLSTARLVVGITADCINNTRLMHGSSGTLLMETRPQPKHRRTGCHLSQVPNGHETKFGFVHVLVILEGHYSSSLV